MTDFCKVVDQGNDALVKYAENVPVLAIKCKRPGYTLVSKTHTC